MSTEKNLLKEIIKRFEPIKRFASFIRHKKINRQLLSEFKEIWIALGLALVVVIIILVAALSTVEKVTPEIVSTPNEPEPVAEVLRHPLTGAIIDQSIIWPQVFGIMIENSADAWPLSGLDKAFLVIEAPVESDIPRFIAFYEAGSQVDKIGPVRSARPYYLDWNDELQSIYVHCGGSPEALELISQYKTIDLNQFYQSEYFYRQNGTRFAPHNVYTTGSLLTKSITEVAPNTPDYQAWKFKEDKPVSADAARSLLVDFAAGSTYDIKWQYNAAENNYDRYQAGKLMTMENGATIEADNIVVMASDIRVIDRVGRKKIITVGEGDALIAQDGEVYLARWKKDARSSRLTFYTTDGYEISMNAGKTWIEVVPNLSQAESYQE